MLNWFVMLKDFVLILKAEFNRDFLFMKRYPLEPLSFLFFMYLILLSILLGFSQLLNDADVSSADFFNRERMILGYCLMQFVFSTQMGWSGQIQYESQTGTLEQLSISGHSLGGVLLARGISQLLRQILSFFILLSAYVFTLSNIKLSLVDGYRAVPVLIVMAFGIYGISYFFAGITLLFKRVGMFFQVINFAFLGIFWQNRESLTDGSPFALFYDYFPLSVGMTKLQNALVIDSSHIYDFSFLHLIIISSVYFAAGFILFRIMEKRARRQGLLSQY